jgi:hypothetical protein
LKALAAITDLNDGHLHAKLLHFPPQAVREAREGVLAGAVGRHLNNGVRRGKHRARRSRVAAAGFFSNKSLKRASSPAHTWGAPANPAVLVMFTTRPLVSISRGSRAFVMRTPAKKFTSMIRCVVAEGGTMPHPTRHQAGRRQKLSLARCMDPPDTSAWESGPPRSPDCVQRGWQTNGEQKPRGAD